ncbi:MAG TPA: hypothetical protein VJP78_01570 [Thermoleophilia bacterium]|nr:hypothetical protein [Thermoleophilia bacterium]
MIRPSRILLEALKKRAPPAVDPAADNYDSHPDCKKCHNGDQPPALDRYKRAFYEAQRRKTVALVALAVAVVECLPAIFKILERLIDLAQELVSR